MRELKFRVWNVNAKSWVMESQDDYPGECRAEISLEHGLKFTNAGCQIDNLVFQQFTGLTDIEGEEIYEGDIVAEQYTDEMAALGVTANVGQVYFSAGAFMIDGEGPLYDRTHSLTPNILEDYKVIGNIFQNPELIKT